MKTAKQYIFDIMGCEPVHSRMDYVDALAAVQAAIDDAGTVGEQLTQALHNYFDAVLPEPSPTNAPPIRLGERAQVNVFPPACPRCLLRRDQCVCPPLFPENPPF